MRLALGHFRRRPPVAAILGILLLAFVAVRWLSGSWFSPSKSGEEGLLREGVCRLITIEPGPLLLVSQRHGEAGSDDVLSVSRRVRLLGLETDSPEAAEFIHREAQGKELRLAFDKRRVDRDDYWLAYVYLDDVLLNEQLVEIGFARVKDYPGDSASIAKRLRAAETRAKAEKRGVWSSP